MTCSPAVATGPPAGTGESSVYWNPWGRDGPVRVFAANRRDLFIQSGHGSVGYVRDPGAYNTAVQDHGIHGCRLSAPRRVVVEQRKTAFVTLEVPDC